MDALWTEDLSPEERDQLIEKLSNEITKRGLEVPAAFFLEMHKPLANIAGQSMIAFSPFLAPFFGMSNVHDYSRLMMKRDNFDLLLDVIEAKANEKKESEGTKDEESSP